MVRIADPDHSRAAYEALGFAFERDRDIVRNGELEATNYFFGIGDQESVLELTSNHDGRTYELGTGYGHIAVGVDDLAASLAELKEQGIEPERGPTASARAARRSVSSSQAARNVSPSPQPGGGRSMALTILAAGLRVVRTPPKPKKPFCDFRGVSMRRLSLGERFAIGPSGAGFRRATATPPLQVVVW